MKIGTAGKTTGPVGGTTWVIAILDGNAQYPEFMVESEW